MKSIQISYIVLQLRRHACKKLESDFYCVAKVGAALERAALINPHAPLQPSVMCYLLTTAALT